MMPKIAVFGAGTPGLDVALQLHGRGLDLVLLDDDDAALELAGSKGFRTEKIDYRRF